MSAEHRTSMSKFPAEGDPKSRRGILQSPPHEEEVASSLKGNPGNQQLNVEACEGSNARRNAARLGVFEIRDVLRESQQATTQSMKIFLQELKQTLADHAKLVSPKPLSHPRSTDEGGAAVTTPVRLPLKRTPSSALATRKKKKSMVELWEETKAAAATKRRFDPNFPLYDHRSISGFDEWYTKASASPYQRFLRLSSKVVPVVDSEWFHCIRDNGCLQNQQMDVLASLIVREQDEDRALSPIRKWTWMESDTWHSLKNPEFAGVLTSLWPFITGKAPTEGGKPWSKATRVFGFAKVMENRWLCYEICFLKQRIMVVDSCMLPWTLVSEAFVNMRKHIPYMCKMARVWEAHGFTEALRSEWDVVPYPNPPNAPSPEDTSVMALKVMQSLAYDVEPSLLLGNRCDNFRKHLCGRLFATSPDIADIVIVKMDDINNYSRL